MPYIQRIANLPEQPNNDVSVPGLRVIAQYEGTFDTYVSMKISCSNDSCNNSINIVAATGAEVDITTIKAAIEKSQWTLDTKDDGSGYLDLYYYCPDCQHKPEEEMWF